jgi:hypothetical protein
MASTGGDALSMQAKLGASGGDVFSVAAYKDPTAAYASSLSEI